MSELLGNIVYDKLQAIFDDPQNTKSVPDSVVELVSLPTSAYCQTLCCFDRESQRIVMKRRADHTHIADPQGRSAEEEDVLQRLIREWEFLNRGVSGVCPGIARGFPNNEKPWILYETVPCGPLTLFPKVETELLDLNWDYTNLLIVMHRVFTIFSRLNAKGLVHRSVTTMSFMMNENMIPFLWDFEYVKCLNGCDTNAASEYYAAPEVLAELIHFEEHAGQVSITDKYWTGVTDKSDVYSIGMVLYNFLSGVNRDRDLQDQVGMNSSGIKERESTRRKDIQKMTVNVSPETVARVEQLKSRHPEHFDFGNDFRDHVIQWLVQCIAENCDDRPTAQTMSETVYLKVKEWMNEQSVCKTDSCYFIDEDKWNRYIEFTVSELQAKFGATKMTYGTLQQLRNGVKTGSLYAGSIHALICLKQLTLQTEEDTKLVEMFIRKLHQHRQKIDESREYKKKVSSGVFISLIISLMEAGRESADRIPLAKELCTAAAEIMNQLGIKSVPFGPSCKNR